MSCRDATRTSHASGRSGRVGSRQVWYALMSASWTASSASAKEPDRRARMARACGASSRAAGPRSSACRSLVGGVQAEDLAHLDRMTYGGTTCTRRRRNPGGDLDRPLDGVDFDQAVAGDELLELGVRAVGHDRLTLAVPDHELRRVWRCQPFGADQLTESSELVVEHLLELDVGGDVLWRPVGDRHCRLIPAAERLDEHEAHDVWTSFHVTACGRSRAPSRRS